MPNVIVNKKAKVSRSQKNALGDWKKLSTYAHYGSVAAQKLAKQQGVAITVIENGSVVKIAPDGSKTKVERKSTSTPATFHPLQPG